MLRIEKNLKVEEQVKSRYIQYKFNFLHCGLHLIVCSKLEDWLKKVEAPPCPECGKRELLQLKKDKSKFLLCVS